MLALYRYHTIQLPGLLGANRGSTHLDVSKRVSLYNCMLHIIIHSTLPYRVDLGVSALKRKTSEYVPIYIIVGIVQMFLVMNAMSSYDIVQHIYVRIVIVKNTVLNQDRFQCMLYLKTLPCVLLFYDVLMIIYN